MRIYLAGNIDYVSYSQAKSWRELATQYLSRHGHTALDPMAEYKSELDYHKVSNQEIFDRNVHDVRSSDLLLVNFNGKGLGTPFEMGLAHALNKPLVVCTQDYLRHPFVTSVSVFYSDDLLDCLAFCCLYPCTELSEARKIERRQVLKGLL